MIFLSTFSASSIEPKHKLCDIEEGLSIREPISKSSCSPDVQQLYSGWEISKFDND